MRIKCPICGDRDMREYYYQGDAVMIHRPAPDAGDQVWDDYLHNRDNLAGDTRELWHHGAGCGEWVVVTRNTVTHAISNTALARDVKGASS